MLIYNGDDNFENESGKEEVNKRGSNKKNGGGSYVCVIDLFSNNDIAGSFAV